MGKRIFVAGHKGMVGSSITRNLLNAGGNELILKSKDELNLLDQAAVKRFFENECIEQVYLCAARVGGIYANDNFPADFIYDNLMVQANVINSAFLSGVQNLLFLGSSCIYPRLAAQPITEDSLLVGPLEPTNEPYALAKIVGIKMCESYNRQFGHSHGIDYRSVMPTNLYGPGDNYFSKNSHVIPALISKFYQARTNNDSEVLLWGSGKAKREFLHVDDMAEACVFAMNLDKDTYRASAPIRQSHLNVGSGVEVTILKVAEAIAEIMNFKGQIVFDSSMPDGVPAKLLDSSKIGRLGWKARYSLFEGLHEAIHEFEANIDKYSKKDVTRT